MEDHNQSRNQTNSTDDDNVIELSTEMALQDQEKHKIIDLTDDIDNPVDQDATSYVEKPIEQEVADGSESTPADDATASSIPSVSEVEEIIISTSEQEQPAAIVDETTDTIENEVDAAFDAVAVQPPEPVPAPVDNLLFDELSDITKEVDEAAAALEEGEYTDSDQLQPDDPAPVDDEDISAQAAELEASMAGDFDDNDQHPTGSVAEQQEQDISDEIEEIENDLIIELVDVVDPSELDYLEAEAIEEDKIIELTQIVDIDELEGFEEGAQNRQSEIEASSPTEKIQPLPATAGGQSAEEAFALSEIDEFSDLDSDLDGEIDASVDTEDIFDAAELDGLFDDDIPEDETTESVNTLSDDTAIVSDPSMEEANALFDIVEDFDNTESFEENTVEQIEPIPSLEETDGLFDIEDQNHESRFQENASSDTMDIEPITPLADNNAEQEQVIQLADVLSASKRPPLSEHSQLSSGEDMDDLPVGSETQDETNGTAPKPEEETADDSALFEDKKIEAAVEKIIRTKYADKLEQLIASAVEKAVTQEIANIRRSLSDNEEPSE